MIRKYLLGFTLFVIAFAVLSVSVFKSASVRYAFATPSPEPAGDTEKVDIGYTLPYPGRIMPDNPLWPVKALRDRVWYLLTTNPAKKTELALLFSDKRLGMSKSLFEKQKPELAFSTLTKGEKYLEESMIQAKKAGEKGEDIYSFLGELSTASLKHRQVIGEILLTAPEDAKPEIIKTQDYSKNIYKETRDLLNSKGIAVPKNPFNGE